MTDVYITQPNPVIEESSSFTATTYFRNGDSADTPTTAQYRVDCLTTGKTLTEWTDLSVSTSNTITVTSSDNDIQDDYNALEKKRVTVQANQGTNTQTRDSVTWKVRNQRHI